MKFLKDTQNNFKEIKGLSIYGGKILNNNIPYNYTEKEKLTVERIINGDLDILDLNNNLKELKFFYNFLNILNELTEYAYWSGSTIDNLLENIKDEKKDHVSKKINFYNENKLKFEQIYLKISIFLNKLKSYYEKVKIDVESKKQNNGHSDIVELILSGRIYESRDKLLKNENVNEFDLKVLSISAPNETLKIFEEKQYLVKKYPDIYDYILNNTTFSKVIELIGASEGLKDITDENKIGTMFVNHIIDINIKNILSIINNICTDSMFFLKINSSLIVPKSERNFFNKIYLEFLDKFNILAFNDEQVKNLIIIGINSKLKEIFVELQNEKDFKLRHGEILALFINTGKFEVEF